MSRGTAALIEVIGGFFQIFGLGHIATGYVGFGLLVMLLYVVLSAINVALMFVLIGFVTYPITWVAFMIFSPLSVAPPRQ